MVAFLAGSMVAQDDKKPQVIAPFEKSDISMRELIDFLQKKGAPLNFEEYPATWDDGVSYQKVLDTFGKQKVETLNEREKWWLELARKTEKETAKQLATIFHYYEVRFDLKTEEPLVVHDLLKVAITKGARYRIWEGDNRLGVVPATNDFRDKNMLIMPPTVIGEAIFKLGRDVTEPNGFAHAMVYSGPVRETYLSTKKEISLSLFDMPVYDVMDRFSEAISASMECDYVWRIGGYIESRHFNFVQVKKAE